MPRVHKDYREGRCARFTNESKFWPENNIVQRVAQEAISEGENLRKLLTGRRILLDLSGRELKNAYRL